MSYRDKPGDIVYKMKKSKFLLVISMVILSGVLGFRTGVMNTEEAMVLLHIIVVATSVILLAIGITGYSEQDNEAAEAPMPVFVAPLTFFSGMAMLISYLAASWPA